MITPAQTRNILKYSAAGATMAAPAVYMIHFHDKLYKGDPVGRKKMLNKMLGFWGGMSAGVYAVHHFWRKQKAHKPALIASIAFTAIAPYLGVKLAKIINKQLFPKKQIQTHQEFNYQKQMPVPSQVQHFTYNTNKDFMNFVKTFNRQA